jgi:hypothetical protein
VINSYARIPGIVWKLGWAPTPTGEPRTQLPPLPLDLLQDKDVLEELKCEKFTDDRRRTPSDGNSSPGPLVQVN